MPGVYSVNGNATNTQSATLPLVTLIGHANKRLAFQEIVFGAGVTPADNAMRMLIQRCTAAGTPGSSITPQAWDPGDPTALGTAGLAVFSVGPTLTANAYLATIPINMRATYRFVIKDNYPIYTPATTSNGIAFMPVQVSTAWDLGFGMLYLE